MIIPPTGRARSLVVHETRERPRTAPSLAIAVVDPEQSIPRPAGGNYEAAAEF
jgi:hypothetical protein